MMFFIPSQILFATTGLLSDIIPKPLDVDDYMEIGYILPDSIRPSALTINYLEILKKLCA